MEGAAWHVCTMGNQTLEKHFQIMYCISELSADARCLWQEIDSNHADSDFVSQAGSLQPHHAHQQNTHVSIYIDLHAGQNLEHELTLTQQLAALAVVNTAIAWANGEGSSLYSLPFIHLLALMCISGAGLCSSRACQH